jgi:hypothetical protein
MRIVALAVVMTLCWGCAGPGQSGSRTDLEERTQTEGDSSEARRDAIRELVEQSEIIVLAKIAGVHNGVTRDVGIGYDVVLETVLYGSDVPSEVLRFRSEGLVGCAKYHLDEKVLLFLRRGQSGLTQVSPPCYIASEPSPGGLDLRPVGDFLGLIKDEIEAQQSK